MRFAVAILAAVAVLAAGAGCGSDDRAPETGDTPKALEYFPQDAAFVGVVSTDLDGEQFRNLDRLVQRQGEEPIEEELRGLADELGLSWDDDVEPLLGRELAGGVVQGDSLADGDFEFVIAFHSADGDKLRELLDRDERLEEAGEISGARAYRLGFVALALDGDVLVAADSTDSLQRALDRADGDEHLGEAFASALDDLPGDALFRLFVDTRSATRAAAGDVEELARLQQLPWFDALRSAGVAVSFGERDVTVDFALNTDPSELEERDLPLATGTDAPEVLPREDEVAGGNRNQSLTTAFLFRMAEVLLPDSKFVRDVHELERELNIDFVDEVLRQFDGPSASSVSLDGETFAARSVVRDPAGLKQLLPRLAPHLPRLVAGLNGLQSEGQALLFLLAPDAIVLRSDDVTVTRVDADFWRVTGLKGEGPDKLYFGVLGNLFLVASSEDLARRVAKEETVPVDGARGAGVLRVDLSNTSAAARERLDLDDVEGVGEVVAWLQAATERLRGQVRVEIRD